MSFTGAPMYKIVLRPASGNTFTDYSDGLYTIHAGDTIKSFTDKTGAPGIIIPKLISLTADTAVICKGDSVTLTAVAAGAVSYSFDNGDTWQAAATKVASPTADLSYILKVKSITGHVSGDSKTVTVVVNPLPVATVTARTICYNTTAACSATLGAGITTAMTYTWNIGGNSSTTTGNSKTSGTLTATTTYTVQLKNACGCEGAAASPATITVHPNFSSGAIATTGQPLCKGAALNDITGGTAASGGDTPITYQWTYAGAGASAATLSTNSATVTLSFTSPSAVFGACAYAINYPPVGEYVTASSITFTGTPPFDLVLSSGGQISVQTGYELVGSETLVSFTDKTGAPGTFACVPPAAPTVAEATFCFGFPGQLTASAPDGGTIKWYNATAGGDLLYTGNVFPLTTPLYNTSAQYYAQSVLAGQCVSLTRTQAIYTVNNCKPGRDCPTYTAGSVGTGTPSLAVCSAFYPGQIGVAGYRAACVSYSAGQIGRSQ